jgi:hypothetical protein
MGNDNLLNESAVMSLNRTGASPEIALNFAEVVLERTGDSITCSTIVPNS